MLNFGKKICTSRDKKNKYSNSCVVRKKNSERNKKPYLPPFKLNGRPLMVLMNFIYFYPTSSQKLSFKYLVGRNW